ncbi:Interferon-induced GTP-binding protein [Seminavis robusta]|uniref:Interferon-induced GTP-binding protein n=1 Tax=Seminavis robusta TaxID=568900 RepID=A0A9N8HBN5_9STRA|nr:Interferon-induced GTP-binding protein [Seminavis robusta]|eukprot:Sro189_g081560.1 Interferon-induced GTP-binding protein (663) ;mRNA; r:63406-65510
MIVTDSDYLEQLEIVRKIRETITTTDEISLPQICVIGDQSSGKSSFLSRLTGVRFPTAAKMCTKAAVVVTCNRDTSLPVPRYEIEDWENPGHYVETESTAEAIDDTQNKLLRKKFGGNGAAWDEEDNAIVADQSIKLRVTGPDVIDIIIVDLPGIQHAGKTKEAIDALIEANIEKPETLNLIVSEAKQDAELTKAIEIAAKYDPNQERTIRVLSKFDNFDTPDTKQRAVRLIKEGLSLDLNGPADVITQLNLGPHAVISIGTDGKLRSDREGDTAEASQLLNQYQVPQSRAGILTLKERLQPLFARLIKQYLPLLKQNASDSLNEAQTYLQKVGEKPVSKNHMVTKCMESLQRRKDELEKKLTDKCLFPLQSMINAVESKLTFEYVTATFQINAFQCVVFQGKNEFDEAVEMVKEIWEPIVHEFIKRCCEVIVDAVQCLRQDEATKIYSKLVSSIQAQYQEHMKNEVLPKFKDSCIEALDDEAFYGTTNHYFNAKFRKEEICPKELEDAFVQKATALLNDNVKSPYNNSTSYRNVNVNYLKECLQEAAEEVAAKHVHSSLKETQKKRLFYAVKANFVVAKKTFVDNILKKTKGILIKGHVKWIDTKLLYSEKIQDAAGEDETVVKLRADLIAKIERLEECMTLLRDVPLPSKEEATDANTSA